MDNELLTGIFGGLYHFDLGSHRRFASTPNMGGACGQVPSALLQIDK